MSSIFEIIKDACNYRSQKSEDIEFIRKRVAARGYSNEQFELTIQNYGNLNVLMEDGGNIRLMN